MNESLSSAHLSSVDWLGHLSFALNSSEEVGRLREKKRKSRSPLEARQREISCCLPAISISISILSSLSEAELSSSERQSFSYLYHAEQSINLSRVEFRPYRAAEHSSLPSEFFTRASAIFTSEAEQSSLPSEAELVYLSFRQSNLRRLVSSRI